MPGTWVRWVASAVLLAAFVTGCTEPQDKAPGSFAPAADGAKESPLAEALSLVGPDTTWFEFYSDRRSAERLDLLGEEFDTAAAQATHFEKALDEVPSTDLAALGGELSEYMRVMVEGRAPFSQADVRWTLRMQTGTIETGERVLVHRLVDGVDMTTVADDLLKAGFEATDLGDGWVRYFMNGRLSDRVDVLGGNVVAGRYPADFFPEVRLHQERSLLVVGEGDGSEILDLDGGELTPQELGLTSAGDAEDVEYLSLTAGGLLHCEDPVNVATDNRATPERIREWRADYNIARLGRPVVSLLYWVPSEPVVLKQAFRDVATARQAYAGRRQLYHGPASQSPNALGVIIPAGGDTRSPYEPGWTMALSGRTIEIQHNRTAPADAIHQHQAHGSGFDSCDPAANYLSRAPSPNA
jgi:hypothetical protein